MLDRSRSLLIVAVIAFGNWTSSVRAAGDRLDFNRDVRTILSDKCFACHGPDEAARQAGLRLDVRESALKPTESGAIAIVPENVDASVLVKRIFSTDPAEVMPPADSNRQLSESEKATLKRWIAEGANFAEHWSFVAPTRQPVPATKDLSWPKNDLDRFILARLESEGLRPSPEASREMLIRRVTFDLTGLPPRLEEIDAFLADQSPDAYQKVVDRLLASPQFGERMALDWLDAARYADTHGYHIDSARDMTKWREYVINAFNHNKPFDQFIVEQMAGDLLPHATVEQKIASGFNRNHMINFEGGAIPDEYHNAYIVDRVNTFGTVFLGLTVGCAQCHDHKYDPLSQKEYYGLYAFFHNVPEKGLDGKDGNAAPVIALPTKEQSEKLELIRSRIAKREASLNEPDAELDDAQAKWEQTFAAGGPKWSLVPAQGEAAATLVSNGGAQVVAQEDGSWRFTGENPQQDAYTFEFDGPGNAVTGVRLEVLPDDDLNDKGPGRSSNGNIVMTDVRCTVRSGSDAAVPISFRSASSDFSQKEFPASKAIDGDPKSGWAIYPEVGSPHSIALEFEEPLKSAGRVEIVFEFHSPFTQHQPGRVRLSLTDSAAVHDLASIPRPTRLILQKAPAERTEADKAALRNYYRSEVSPSLRSVGQELARLRDESARIEKAIPTAMVMAEMPKPRDTFVLMRGEYDKKGERVSAKTPAALPPLADGLPENRLGLARWLVAAEQPLTPRVTVNRYWQMFFGTGLVETADDFGSQGAKPTHPELLDWLAWEFTHGSESNPNRVPWDVKAFIREIVTSATYRQTSAVTPELLAKDPANRLLGRGPRFRLQAEFIRDQALAVSRLLSDRIGGESVSPYQPAGLWEELMSREDGDRFTAQKYVQSHGSDLYRRTMYTFWKRTCPPPTLATFDAPDRETCTVRRARTNTPLQALVLLNDPTYIEASRKLAERILTEGGETADSKIDFLFRLATARRPSDREHAILMALLRDQEQKYREDPKAAEQLLGVGESPRNTTLPADQVAAWTTMSSAVLNLDEAVTRN
ncbi:Planctomycete cytochrome C [Caulifigura coniformis]|uniref:Planctomycete cytochrome C n=1 Tax=Caulifigura coniformis TaxID=2527983 RepID=A0A517SJY3_9PLAN|nr:PSD1 and planctomycete cytochrome C domain-containing protein [Caulifigura coniformis]QDT56432.1 Planctomycete cytochrome C [Caulifigura coniformis]